MGDSTKISNIRSNSRMKRSWERLDFNARRFVLAEVEEDVSEATLKQAIKKYRNTKRRKQTGSV